MSRSPLCRSCPATSLTRTHAHRATDDGWGGDLGSRGAPRVARVVVHDGVGGEDDREDGVAMCLWRLWWRKGLTTLRSFFDLWDLGVHLNGPLSLGFHLNGPLSLGFHLNGPLSRWTGKGVGDVGGVLEAPTLGPIGFRFSRVPPPTFSAAHTDLEYLKNHVRDGGPASRCIYVATWGTDFVQP